MSELTFGCDPELFLRNIKTGEYVSAHGIIPGTKEEPHKVGLGAVQVDGMAVEFNIDPVKSGEDFSTSVKHVLAQLSEMIGPDLELVAKPTVHFSDEVFAAQPKEALELGCDPDYNAYTGEQNTPPNGDVKFRTGAGHIHIGWCEGVDVNDPEHIEVCRTVIKQMDYFLGVTSHFWDKDTERRQLYGKQGAYRVKPYGVEYRPLSNAWLNIPELYAEIPRLVQLGWDKLQESYPRVCNKDHVPHFFDRKEVMDRFIPDDWGWTIGHVPPEITKGLCKEYSWGNKSKGIPSIESLLKLPKGVAIKTAKKVVEKERDLLGMSAEQAQREGRFREWLYAQQAGHPVPPEPVNVVWEDARGEIRAGGRVNPVAPQLRRGR